MVDWDLSCVDWQERIRSGRSLMPALPLWSDRAAKAVRIFNRLRIPDVTGTPTFGSVAGEWQREIVAAIHGSLDPETQERLVRELFCLVPKKNAKTTFAAGLMVTSVLMNERPRAEFLIVAPTKEIADLGFRQADGMIFSDPALQRRFQVQSHLRRITYLPTQTTLQVKSFDPSVMTGVKPAGILVDEEHVVAEKADADRVMGQIRGGMTSQAEAFLAIITTQSERPPRGVFRDDLMRARSVRDGGPNEGRMLPIIYELPDELQRVAGAPGERAPWEDPACSDARTVYLAQLQATISAHREEGPVLDDAAQKNIALAGALAQGSVAYQHSEQAITDLSSSMSGIFSTLGDDISQAFTQGGGSAVTFKSVLQGLESQIVELILKFAVLNPLMNSLFGQNNTTLSGIASALGGSSLSGSGASSGLSISTMGSLASLGNSASGGGLLSSLGLGGVGSGISGILGTNLWGGTSAASAIANSGDINAAYTTTSGLGGTSLGSLLGGAGLGFGAGSLLNGLIGGNKLGGTAGSGVGGLAGAAIGSIIPGVGTIIGGLLGGAGGGLLGGLFGGHAKNPYTLDTVSTAGGQLSLGSSYNQAETDATTAQLKADIASLNSTFATLGATVSSVTGKTNLGPIGDGAGNAVSSIAGRLGALRLTGSTATETQAYSSGLSTADDASVSAFQTAVTALKSMADTVDTLGVKVKAFNADAATVTVGGAGSFSGYSAATTSALDHALDGKTISTSDLQTQISTIQTFVDTTMPGLLTATTSGASDYQTQLAGLTSTYTAAEAQASALGISTDGLASKLSDLSAQMLQTQEETLRQQTDALKVRDYTATGNTEAAAMLTAADNNSTETTAFNQSWQDIYGSAYATAAGYAQALQLLQQTQGDEMIALQKQYDAQELQLTQAAHSAMAGAVENAYTAQASLADDGTPGGKVASLTYAENGALYAFDDQRQAALDAFSKSLTDAYGQSITTTAGYAAEMAQEETTLGLQRLAIVKSYSDQIAAVTSASYSQAQQSATSLLNGLSDYATSLVTSNLSPLSAADQYKAANDDYTTDLQKAQGGDFTAMQALQGYANTLLTEAQAYQGSGTDYDDTYLRVLKGIQSIAGMGSDAITASALNASLAPIGDTLNTAVAKLSSILTELQQANMRKGKAA